ncbi:MAG: class I SAM-dependent methyltransferase [Deltaproteobacteria bacterium]|nr:class I SAM-dependent methyltransferase [Deltaproteobacteria bacterium]
MRKDTLLLFEQIKTALRPESAFIKTLTAIYLFDFLDRLRVRRFPENWLEILGKEVDKLREISNLIRDCYDIPPNDLNDWSEQHPFSSFEAQTGNVYFQLWKDFSKEEYFSQATALLQERFVRNQIDLSPFQNALDAGCGGGRYSLALRKIGLPKVTALDVSPDSIQFARKMSVYPDDEVRFLTGSVLQLPFPDSSFDFVFSNGVLHHTASTEKGLTEIFRVLRPGGCCWLYLYGGKESLFWDIADLCRELLADVPQGYSQDLMKVMGYPAGRIFHRADFWYVPVNRRYFSYEVEDLLEQAGFHTYKRLARGTGYDWDEIIFQAPHIDPYIYGEGEMRYWLCK